MSDFISREAAIKLFNFAVLDCLGMEPTIRASDVIKALESIPAADVRPVVTCIECKHSCDMPGGLRCCYGTCVDFYVDPEFFCADGEKREES